jgi:hypothetical protein
MKPDSPLPWEIQLNEIVASDGTLIAFDLNYSQDTDYIIQACNSYPKLIEFVKRAHVGLHGYEAEELLEELGERGDMSVPNAREIASIKLSKLFTDLHRSMPAEITSQQQKAAVDVLKKTFKTIIDEYDRNKLAEAMEE